MSHPLEGMRIADFTRMLPGPYCTHLLADMGADVIKVEDLHSGDPMRLLPPYLPSGMSVAYLNLNKNKRGIAVDLKAGGAIEILLELVEWADVLVEQYRPGVMDRIGLSYDVVREANEKIVYCSITGYGQYGPYRDVAAHDLNFMAISGMLDALAHPGSPPSVCPVQVADLAAGGMMGAVSILAAYIEMKKTGQGSHVDVSIMDGTISMLAMNLGELHEVPDAESDASLILNGGSPWYRIYKTVDGFMAVATIENKFWAKLCEMLGKPEYIKEQYNKSKFDEISGWLGAVLIEKTTQEWVDYFQGEDVCVSPVNRVSDIVRDPQVAARGMISSIDYENTGKATVIGTPFENDDRVRIEGRPAARLGEHTEEVLDDLGFDTGRIEKFKSSGVIQ